MTDMDSRERVSIALAFGEPDRVPIDLWMSDGFKSKIGTTTVVALRDFQDDHDVDLRYIDCPRYTGPPMETFDDGSSRDIWGVRRLPVTMSIGDGEERYSELVEYPLTEASTVEEIVDYKYWPSPDWFDYSEIADQCRTISEKGRVAVFVGDRLNRLAQLKPAMYIRGMEQIYIDLAERAELAHAVISHIREFYLGYAERIFDAADGHLDIVLTGDDFGSQNGPLVSPTMWKQFLGNGFEQYVQLAKSYGLKVMHHTCGSVVPIIPMLIERDLDVLQSLQPEAMNMKPESLKAEFGDRLAFHGGISIQQTMPFGTVEDVRQEVKDRAETLATGGGYIFCTSHNLQADVPVENALALLNAYREFGVY